MKFDEAMTAAKNKVSKESRQAELNELDNAAQELQEVNTAVAGMPLCRLPGCEKPVLNADLTGYKYCSRRHYYKATNGGDGERARAALAAVLLASQADHAEGFAVFEREENKRLRDRRLRVLHDRLQALQRGQRDRLRALRHLLRQIRRQGTFRPTWRYRRWSTGFRRSLRAELVRQNEQLLGCEAERIRYVQRISELHERISELSRELTESRRIPLPPAPDRRPARIHYTTAGRRYHVRADCGHTRNHDSRTLTPCQDCSR